MRRLYNLNGLNIPLLLSAAGFKQNFIKRHEAKYYYLISKILYKYSMRLNDKNGFVRISTDELVQKLKQCKLNGCNKYLYLLIRKQLYDWVVIHFKTIQKSKDRKEAVYKIKDEWREKGYSRTNINPLLYPKLNYWNEPQSKIEYKGIYKLLQTNLNNVHIDSEKAYKWLYKSYSNRYKLPSKRNERWILIEREINISTVSSWSTMIDNCIEHSWYNADLGKSGRVFNPFTSLPKQLRAFVKYNNQLLIEIDVSNSQPLIFCILIRKWLIKKGILTVPNDVSEYIQLCENGNFYNYVIELMKNNGEDIVDKKIFKGDFFARIFFSTEKKKHKWRKIFDNKFPNVSRCISELKAEAGKEQNIAVQLQALEADIIIKGVCSKLFENKILEFYPIHDAIYTTVENLDRVKKIIEEEFLMQGLQPTVNVSKKHLFEYVLMRLIPTVWEVLNYTKGNIFKEVLSQNKPLLST